jgi:hypothetical protein
MSEKRQCPHVTSCPMFELFELKQVLQVWRTYYCEFTFEQCERYRRFSAGEKVPLNLLPNGKILDVAGGDKG